MATDAEVQAWIDRAIEGDTHAVNELFACFRDRLVRMVELRLDDRVRTRLDPGDVVQEALLGVFRRLPQYLEDRSLPFYLWLRLEVGRHLLQVHRHHLGVQKRDARRDILLSQYSFAAPSSSALAVALVAASSTPSQAVVRQEREQRVQEAVDSLDPLDKEILTLRHFEGFNRSEAARILGISEEAAAKRYIRALDKLERLLADQPGGVEGL
jgi:RNA polymerase sigma-70 factor (ECF subfamily)